MICLISPVAFAQYGHSKSENSTNTTRAVSGPSEGEPAVGICTGSSSSLGAGRGLPIGELATILATSSGDLPSLKPRTIIVAMPLLYPQLGSSTRHCAIFMLH